jgi:beta-galactosidase
MYQSEWTDKTMLHVFPHWNWRKGEQVDIWAYYNNADEVELYLNGKSLGIRKKINDDLHIMWRVPFEPGTLKAISRKNGRIVLIKEIKTAGKPCKIELTADKNKLIAGSENLCFITARLLDKEGNLVPDADDLIKFSLKGNATIAGTDNGYQADSVSLSGKERRAWKGIALVIVKATSKKGNNTLIASATGLPKAKIIVNVH